MNGETDGWTDLWTDGSIDGWMDGRSDGWMNGRTGLMYLYRTPDLNDSFFTGGVN